MRFGILKNEPAHDTTYKIACAPSKDSDQPELPPSLIRVFPVHSIVSKGHKLSLCGQQTLIGLGKYPG